MILKFTSTDIEHLFDLMGLTSDQAYDFWTLALDLKTRDDLDDLAKGGVQRGLS